MLDLVINSSIQHTLLLFIPLLFAIILKLSRVRSWSLLAGVISGVLLGPAVFGSVAPSYWEGLFQGGVADHVQYEKEMRQHDADILAAQTLGVSETIILQMKADQQYELSQEREVWDIAKWKDQRTLRVFVIALIILIFLSGTVRSKVQGTAPPMMSLSVGVWAAIIPCSIVAMLALWFLDVGIPTALAFGACLAAGPWTLTRWEQQAADESESGGASLMIRCGRVAWLTAIAIALYATWQSLGAMSLIWLLPLILLPIMWMIPSKQWKWFTLFVDYAAIPSVMATSLVLIHPIEDLAPWPILIVIIFCADARWLGGIIGLGILGGRESGSALRLAIPLVDAGISQLCMAALLFGAGVLTPSLTLAVLLGAVFLDRTASIRMKFATP
jgi:hypothetical protein